MKQEFIVVNGQRYGAMVTTGQDSVSFSPTELDVKAALDTFRTVTELEVAGEDGVVYGHYGNLSFASAVVNTDNVVTVTMHIAPAVEVRLAALEATQAEQDAAIAELIGGEA